MLEPKSILITGCSSGIGYDAAHRLAARGWQVFATCRSEDDCSRLRAKGLQSFVLDYKDEATIKATLAQVLAATGGRLDALFNNGAFALPGAIEDLPRAGLRDLFETNVFGWHDLTQQVIPVMRAQGKGRIVNCSSVLGLVCTPWRGAYNASKFAIEALSDTLRLEMRNTGIEVILIEPGPITSKIRQNAVIQFERWIDWQASARADEYRAILNKRLYDKRGKDQFELPASAVTHKLIKALESTQPRPRYFVTTPTYVMWILKRVLSTRALDWLLAKG